MSPSNSIKSITQECALLLGYNSVKPEQEEAVKAFVKQQRDVFTAVPTGFRKSLCYSFLPLVFDRIWEDGKSSIVIVDSPLLALMTDQVNTMSKRGLLAFETRSISPLTVNYVFSRGYVMWSWTRPSLLWRGAGLQDYYSIFQVEQLAISSSF